MAARFVLGSNLLFEGLPAGRAPAMSEVHDTRDRGYDRRHASPDLS